MRRRWRPCEDGRARVEYVSCLSADLAIVYGYSAELIELLLKHGADTEALDTADENARPLVHAIEFSDKDLVKLLVDNGARVHDEDVVFALRMGNFAIAAVLGAALRRAPAHPLKKALEAAATLRELLEGYPEVRGF